MAAPLTKLTEIVRGVLQNADIELLPATCFEQLPGWDSMHLIAVVVEIECRFDMLFEPEDIEALHSVGDLLRIMGHKQTLSSA